MKKMRKKKFLKNFPRSKQQKKVRKGFEREGEKMIDRPFHD